MLSASASALKQAAAFDSVCGPSPCPAFMIRVSSSFRSSILQLATQTQCKYSAVSALLHVFTASNAWCFPVRATCMCDKEACQYNLSHRVIHIRGIRLSRSRLSNVTSLVQLKLCQRNRTLHCSSDSASVATLQLLRDCARKGMCSC